MADWAWVVGGTPASGVGPQRMLTRAYGRRVTWRVDAPADAEFTLNANAEEIFAITPLATDLFIYRNGDLLFRGRIGTLGGTLNAQGHTVQFSAVDYRGMLNRRMVGTAGASYSQVDQAAIAWDLINTSQLLPGGNWTVTNGAGATSGVLRDRNYDPGKLLGDAITELGQVDNGFEWEIDSSLSFNRYYPIRGSDNNVKLDYGGTVKEVTYQFNPDDFGNDDLVTGSGDTTVPVRTTSVTASTDAKGLWQKSQGFPSILEQTTLNVRGVWYLQETDTIRFAYHVHLSKGAWGGRSGPGAVWIGDTVHPMFDSGWLQEYNLNHRVIELQAVLDGDGGEDIDLSLLAVATGTDSNLNSQLGLAESYDLPYDMTVPGQAVPHAPIPPTTTATDPNAIVTNSGQPIGTNAGEEILA